MSLQWKVARPESSACTTRRPASRRRRRRSVIETTSKRPSGSQPRPEGCVGTSTIGSTTPSGVTVTTRWPCMSETQRRPSRQRGPSRKWKPSATTRRSVVMRLSTSTSRTSSASRGGEPRRRSRPWRAPPRRVQVDDDGLVRRRSGATVVVPPRPAVSPGRPSRRPRLEAPLRLLGQRFGAQQIRCTRRFGAAEPRALRARGTRDDTHQDHHNESSLHARISTRRATRVGSPRHLRYTTRIDQLPLTSRLAPRDVLTGVFGYQDFRPGQEKIIATVLAGRDCIGVMPTGAGKSLTFQIPARLVPGTVLVVSPLISLMKDQVDALARNGFRATVVNSTLDWETRRDRLRRLAAGEYELVYVAPEGLEGGLRSFLGGVRVSLVVVDEAHCISEWGHDFRPAYRRLRGLKHELGGVPILALTATATRRVAGDIIRQLGMVKPDGFKGSFFRSNLVITAHKKGDGRGSRKDLLAYVRRRSGESGIIYVLTRKNVESLAEFLHAAGIRAVPYHAGLEDAVRARHQDAFARDEVDIVVATIAFGMGIDKSNVRYVIHREMPRSIEGYYQEIGRAGRDGLASDCILLYSWADVLAHRRLQEMIEDAELRHEAGRKSLAIYELAEAPGCRHQSLVARFDETIPACGTACDFCRGTSFADLVRPVKSAPVDRPAPSHDGELFQRLRALRRALADAEGVPAYIVFSDAVLTRMAAARPTDDVGFLAVPGVGPAKLARYGEAFLRVLREG